MDANEAPQPPPRARHFPSLRECCVSNLIKYKQYLGDVGFMDSESLRSIAWHCSPEQLAHIEDETLVGSDRNLEWYTWHLWKRHLKTDLGDGGLQAPDLESEKPVDYVPPRGIADEPADYRTLYMHRKSEIEERTAAAKERIAAAQQQVQEAMESRKAKMIDKLVPAKRARCVNSGSRGGASSLTSAYMHKPRSDSRSSLMSKPGAQLKLLSELGLVKKAAPRSTTSVRVIKPSPVPSAAVGHSSSLAGAQLLSKATGGQLGSTNVGSHRGMHVAAQPPLVAARAAAVAAARAAEAGTSSGGRTAGAAGASRTGNTGSASGKRPADAPPVAAQSPGKMAATGQGGGGGAGPSRPDPRVMFPRQAAPTAPPGQSKFAVPTVRPVTGQTSTASVTPPRPAVKAGRAGTSSPSPAPLSARPSDDL